MDTETLKDEALAWAAANGLLMAASKQTFKHAPFSLLPVPFARSEFEKAVSLAPAFNKLVHRVAQDPQWPYETLEHTAQAVEFTGRLMRLSKEVHAQGIAQPASLGIFRSDYMLDQPTPQDQPRLLQVELNTISSDFGALSQQVTRLHQHLTQNLLEGAPSSSTDQEDRELRMKVAIACLYT